MKGGGEGEGKGGGGKNKNKNILPIIIHREDYLERGGGGGGGGWVGRREGEMW